MNSDSEILLPTTQAKILSIVGATIPAILSGSTFDKGLLSLTNLCSALVFVFFVSALGIFQDNITTFFDIFGKVSVSYIASIIPIYLSSKLKFNADTFSPPSLTAVATTALISLLIFMDNKKHRKSATQEALFHPISMTPQNLRIGENGNGSIEHMEISGKPFYIPLSAIFHTISTRKIEIKNDSKICFHINYHSPTLIRVKRILDVISSAALIVTLSPLLLATQILILASSPGPAIFKQMRIGKNGKPFVIYKFRSMKHNADKLSNAVQHLNERSGPVFKSKQDPRITKVGKFIRKYSIDELPQLFNVLKGDMSLVGPRPPLPSEVTKYEEWHCRRLSMKPGITCEWQVRDRGNPCFSRWVNLDLYYIDNWTIFRDFSILLRTIPAVISARGSS